MTKSRLRHIFYRFFLAIAYLSVTLQWLWIFALGAPQLIDKGVFDSFISEVPVEQPTQPAASSEASPTLAVVAAVITLIFLGLTAIILVRLPKTISQTGEKVIHQATEAIIPVVTHHQRIPTKKKRTIQDALPSVFNFCSSLFRSSPHSSFQPYKQ